MNRDPLDRSLTGWLAEQSSTPTYFEEAMARTRHTRQRPAWSFLERWLPMQLTMRPVYVPRQVFYLALVGLLMVVVAFAAIAIGAGRQPAPPFGPARNGLLAFDQDGSILVTNADRGAAAEVLTTIADAFGPIFAPDGTRLAFYAQRGGADALFVAGADGSQPRALSDGLDLGTSTIEMRPAWSPDSSRIAFTGFSAGRHHLYVANADGSAREEIGDSNLSRVDPAWSPDGQWIAFQHGTDKTSERALYLIRPDGTGEHRVATSVGGSFSYRHPEWLPDAGRQVLAYPVGKSSAYNIAILDVATGTETMVSAEDAAELWPMWSPDGSLLAWNASDAMVRIARSDGTIVRSIPAILDYDFVWSPDGAYLFGWKDEGRSAAVVVSVDGSNATTEIPIQGESVSHWSWQRLAP